MICLREKISAPSSLLQQSSTVQQVEIRILFRIFFGKPLCKKVCIATSLSSSGKNIRNQGTGTSPPAEKEHSLSPNLRRREERDKERTPSLAFRSPAPLPEKEADRHPIQSQSFPETVGQVTLIGEMYPVGIISDHDKSGRR